MKRSSRFDSITIIELHPDVGAGICLQWPAFLAVYGGFWVLQNLIRPLRFALSLAMVPLFDRAVDFTQAQVRLV